MSLAAYSLQTEHRPNPLGIDEPWPLFTWKLRAGAPGRRQAAYHLVVRDAAGAAIWDPGWTEGDDHAEGITYAGPALDPVTRYEVELELRDQDGNTSEPLSAWFETGLLSTSAWQGKWIRRDPRRLPPVDPPTDEEHAGDAPWSVPTPQFRREFSLGSAPRRARAYITARGVYQLRINGHRVGNDELTPGWTDYRTRLQYQAYDITDLLVQGNNVVAVTLADGWWCGYIGFNPRQRAEHYGRHPELLAELRIEDGEGVGTVVATDATWKEHPGQILAADALQGEFHDQRRATIGWDRAGFDDSAWWPALETGSDTSTLVGTLDEPVRVTEQVAPVAVLRSPSGRQLVDFGQNLVGRLRVQIDGLPDGTRLVFRHGETLEDGELYTANLRSAQAIDTVVVAARAGQPVFEPLFTTHGFRYVEVTGWPGEVPASALTAQVMHSDMPLVGDIHVSDEMVEQLISNIRWGQRGNYLSVPTDCPQRDERLGWTADAQIFTPTACFNADLAAFMDRWVRDVVDGQDDDGAFPDVAPLIILDREGAPAWGDAGVIIPHHIWRVYGDDRQLRRFFPAMKAWVDHIERHNPDLIWRHAIGNGYGDWLQIDALTPRDVVATAYFARSASLVAESATAIGATEDAAHYGDLAARIRIAFTDAFAKPDGVIGGGTQTAQLMALAWDLIPDDLRAGAFEHLCADLESRDVRLTTGFVGVPLLGPVLTAGGRDDLAFGLLHQEEFPSWGYSIRRGATTIWERWDGWTEEHGFQSVNMNSFNHYSLGSVGEWLWSAVAGISQAPDSVAFRKLVIAPRLGDRLEWVTATYDSPRGLVEVDFRREGTGVKGRFGIPPGAPAEVRMPARSVEDVTVDGKPLGQSPELEVLVAAGGQVSLRLPAGTWTLASASA